MVSGTKEKDLEIAIEKALTGTWRENSENQIGEPEAEYLPRHHGFELAFSQDFDAQFAIDTRLFWQFLQTSQEAELTRFQQLNPNDWQRKILERLDRQMKKNGVLHLLKKAWILIALILICSTPFRLQAVAKRSNSVLNKICLAVCVKYLIPHQAMKRWILCCLSMACRLLPLS